MDELKPCPFCGSTKVGMGKGAHWVAEKQNGNIRCIVCGDCGVNGGVFNLLAMTETQAEKKAIEAWNRRVDNG